MSDDYWPPMGIERDLQQIEESQHDLMWRSFYSTLTGSLHAHNSGQRNAERTTYRQLLVAILRGRKYEREQIAQMLDCSQRQVERDLALIEELWHGRDEGAEGPAVADLAERRTRRAS